MCRLFGLAAGDRRVTASFWLLDAPDSLEQQSHANPDGCGVAGFDDAGHVEMHKAPVAAWSDPGFAEQSRELTSSTFVAHVRHATTGARTYENTHPFAAEVPFAETPVVFAHNGALGGLDRIEGQLGRFREAVHGDTDSERMFALILAAAAGHGGDLEAGIATAIAWLAANVPVLSCNLILTTASDLWALRYPATNELYLLQRAAGGHRGDAHLRAASREGGIRVHSEDLADQEATIVASEPLDANPGWTLLKPGELIHVDHELHLERRALISRPPSRWLTLPDERSPRAGGPGLRPSPS